MTIAIHPLGFPFYHPPIWRLKVAGGAVQLIPPSGWDERIHLLARAQDTDLRPDDPQVLHLVDRQVHFLHRGLNLVESGVAFSSGLATGIRRGWMTDQPVDVRVEAVAYIRALPGMTVFLVAVARARLLRERRQELEAVVASVGAIPSSVVQPPGGGAVGGSSQAASRYLPVPLESGDPGVPDLVEADQRPRRSIQPDWGFSVPIPAGWQAQRGPWGLMLRCEDVDGRVLIRPHREPDQMALQGLMVQGFQVAELRLVLAGPVRLRHGLVLASLHGQHKGVAVPASAWGSMAPWAGGGGALVVAMGQQMLTPELVGVAEDLAHGVEYL